MKAVDILSTEEMMRASIWETPPSAMRAALS